MKAPVIQITEHPAKTAGCIFVGVSMLRCSRGGAFLRKACSETHVASGRKIFENYKFGY